MANLTDQAAVVIMQALKSRRASGLDKWDLVAKLDSRGIPPWYLPRGVRRIRDTFGEEFLICERGSNIYKIDPSLAESIDYVHYRSKGMLVQATHNHNGLLVMAQQHGRTGQLGRAIRASRNYVEELTDLVDMTA